MYEIKSQRVRSQILTCFRARLHETEVNSNRFEILFRLHGSLHKDFTAASFQTIARPYCTCANDIFYLMQT